MDTKKKIGINDDELQERISNALYSLLSQDDDVKGAIASWLSPTFDDYEAKLEEMLPIIITEYCQCLVIKDKTILNSLESHIDDIYAFVPRVPHCQNTKQECLSRIINKMGISSPQAIKNVFQKNSTVHWEDNILNNVSRQCYQHLSYIEDLLLSIDYDKLDNFIKQLKQ